MRCLWVLYLPWRFHLFCKITDISLCFLLAAALFAFSNDLFKQRWEDPQEKVINAQAHRTKELRRNWEAIVHSKGKREHRKHKTQCHHHHYIYIYMWIYLHWPVTIQMEVSTVHFFPLTKFQTIRMDNLLSKHSAIIHQSKNS